MFEQCCCLLCVCSFRNKHLPVCTAAATNKPRLGSVINRIIKQAVMSWIMPNYDKICFGILSCAKPAKW